MDTNKTGLRIAPLHYQGLVNRITKLAGFKHRLWVYETSSVKTWNTHCKAGVPIIAYNPKFMARACKAGKWAVIAAFASEVIYHYNMDFHGKYICKYYDLKMGPGMYHRRMNMDYFVGRVLRHEGASREEALSVLLQTQESKFENREREQMLTAGWIAANEQLNNWAAMEGKKPEGPATSLAVMLLGMIFYLPKE
jgi:hypothetical protein